MKTLLIALLASSHAHATSLHRCTPTEPARPTSLSCSEPSGIYGIRIDRLVSPPNCDENNSYYEYVTAHVTKYDPTRDESFPLVTIANGEFSYKLGSNGTAVFASRKYRISFTNCSYPQPGGISIGN